MSQPAINVLHVTEAMSAGVLSFIRSVSQRQCEAGVRVEVLYSARNDTPAHEALVAMLHPDVVLLPRVEQGSVLRNARGLYRGVRAALASRRFDYVHLHSSVAGAVGRLAARRNHRRVFYSPHGFAFLRENRPALERVVTQMMEKRLARLGSLILTSASEVDIARTRLSAPRIDYVRSGFARAEMKPQDRGDRPDSQLRVLMVGRMVYQKAPWKFAAVARELADSAEFVWVGGGDAEARREWIDDAPVRVVEWLSREDLDDLLSQTDILLFPTLWEGLSLSLAQAQGRGIPAVTTDVTGNRDAVVHGVTGFVCTSDAELLDATRRLLQDQQLRQGMGMAAYEWAYDHLCDDFLGVETLTVYSRRSGEGSPRRKNSSTA